MSGGNIPPPAVRLLTKEAKQSHTKTTQAWREHERARARKERERERETVREERRENQVLVPVPKVCSILQTIQVSFWTL